MSTNTTPRKAKRGPNGETRTRPNDLKPWELNEKKELIISTVHGFFCAIPHYDEDGRLEYCGADTEFINEYKLREHIQQHHVERKQEAIKLAAEVKRPENTPVKKKWTFLTPTYHPYRRNHSRQSSIAPSVGKPQPRETSVAVDYSTWGFGDGGITPMAMPAYGQRATNTIGYLATASNPSAQASGSSTPYAQFNGFNYGQAATNTIAFPPPGSIPGTPGSGKATPYAQYNASALPAPPSYNPRSTPEQLQAQLTQAITLLHERREQSASLQPIDPSMHFIANVQASASFGLGFNSLANTFGALAPQPLLHFQNAQYAPFAHHGMRQGQIQEFLTQVEQNSPFRGPFPGEAYHPDGWLISAHRRAARWGGEYPAGSMVVPMSEGRIVVVAPAPQGQSGNEQGVVLDIVERDEDEEEEEEEYEPATFVVREEAEKGREEAGELEEGEVGEGEMDMDEGSE